MEKHYHVFFYLPEIYFRTDTLVYFAMHMWRNDVAAWEVT